MPDKQQCIARLLIAVLDETQWGWNGTVLAFSGSLVAEEVEALGRDIGEFDFPPFPGPGLWLWQGMVASDVDGEGQKNNLEFVDGEYRRPTADELSKLAVAELWQGGLN